MVAQDGDKLWLAGAHFNFSRHTVKTAIPSYSVDKNF